MHDDDIPDLPDDQPATGAEIDARLAYFDRSLDEIQNVLAKLREATRASLDGDYEREAEILDELEGDE